jgi:hypothetical protein
MERYQIHVNGKLYRENNEIFYAPSFLDGLKKGLEISKSYGEVVIKVSKVKNERDKKTTN